MKTKTFAVALIIVLGLNLSTLFCQTDNLDSGHLISIAPSSEVGAIELPAQVFGRFGIAPHTSAQNKAVNYYAQFSFWAGAFTQNSICVTSSEEMHKESEWTPLDFNKSKNREKTLTESQAEYVGHFTDTEDVEGHPPLGLDVSVRVYGFSDKGYALLEYTVNLLEEFDPLKGLYLGLQADVDVPDFKGEMTSDDDRLGLLPGGWGIYIFDGKAEIKDETLLGIGLLSAEKPILNWWTRGQDPVIDRERYERLKGDHCTPTNTNKKEDYRFMVSEGPFDLEPGESIIFTVAVLQAEGISQFASEADQADDLFKSKLKSKTLAKRMSTPQETKMITSGLPDVFTLYPGSPNPFNCETQVALDISESGALNVTIYNMLGQVVKVLHQGYMEAGRHILKWDSIDDAGHAVKSGVYILRAQTGASTAKQKLILMR